MEETTKGRAERLERLENTFYNLSDIANESSGAALAIGSSIGGVISYLSDNKDYFIYGSIIGASVSLFGLAWAVAGRVTYKIRTKKEK